MHFTGDIRGWSTSRLKLYKCTINKVLLALKSSDLKKYLQLIERKELKREIETQLQGKQDLAIYQLVSSVWDFITYFTIQIYSEGVEDERFCLTITEEAKRIVDRLLKAYQRGKTKRYIELNSIFPRYDIQHIMQQFQQLLNEKGQMQLDLHKSNHSSIHNSLDYFIQHEEELKPYIQSLIRKKFKGIRMIYRLIFKSYFQIILDLISQAIHDTRSMSIAYGIIFNHDGEVRCFYNVLNLYLHYIIIHGRLFLTRKERELIFAVSALHPVQDDYIDYGEPTTEELDAITAKLRGEENVTCSNEYILRIFKLIDVIYDYYPVSKHPKLVEIFLSLQEWQLISQQQKENCDLTKLLTISFMKGGFAFALFGYIAVGNLTIKQFHHFFGMGAIFQILDDLHDIEDDLNNNVLTVWTKELREQKKIDDVFNSTVMLQKEFERTTSLIKDFKYPVLIRRVELFGARYDLYRFYCMHRKYFSPYFQSILENCFSFELDGGVKFFNQNQEKEGLDYYSKIIDKAKVVLKKYFT